MKFPTFPYACLLALALSAAGRAPAAELPACAAVKPVTPQTFATRSAAQSWARGSFAGADVRQVAVGREQVLVVTVHGSGVATFSIAVYRREAGHWVRAVETAGALFGRAEVQHGAVVRRDPDGPGCVLYRPMKTAPQALRTQPDEDE